MNYYERHIGDYLKDTAHLSLLEHGVYTRLMDVYYTRESAIPANEAARLIGARSKDEREALQAVLTEFFVLIDGAWNQKRCDEELMVYRDSQEGAEDKKLNDKERQRRARARRKDLFEQLRAHGVVPPWDTKTGDLQQMLSRVTGTPPSSPVTQPVTRDNTAAQTPDTRPSISSAPVGASEKRAAPIPRPDDVDAQVWADWQQLRKAKKAPITDTVLKGAKAEAAKAGMSLEAFLRVWCARGSQGLQADWLKPHERHVAAPQPQSFANKNARAKQLLGIDSAPSPQGDFIDG